ncbi:MAG: hypothetical protein NC489_28880 [Ruminococcus flavefaciens]|nr:hypothetical protein [Ruminococcus flavefaciens]
MKLKVNIDAEYEKKVYDEKANIEYEGLLVTDNAMIKIEDMARLSNIITGVQIFDERERKSISQITNSNENDDIYNRECRKEWDRLWDYFDVSEYKERCFPKGERLLLSASEILFLMEFFEETCRPAKDYLSEENKRGRKEIRREVRSFLDRRKKNFDENDKDKIQWAAKNLYQIIRRRVGITEEIREKFFEVTKDKSYVIAKRFDDIKNGIKLSEKLAYDNSGDDCLSIKEKELWVEGLADELKEVINKWNDIFAAMDSLKYENEDKYQGIIKPERLLEDAIKQEREIE